jgi:hypothetical protein
MERNLSAPIIIEIPTQENEPIPDNDWYRSQERVVKGWGDRAKVYRRMHTLAVKHYQRRNKLFGVITAIFPLGSAAVSMTHTILPLGMTGIILGSLGTFYAISTTVLITAYANRAHPEEIAKHDNAVRSYDSLICDIEDQLSRPRHLRDPYGEFSITIKNEQKMLYAMSKSDLPTKITKRYLENKIITKYVEKDIEICSDEPALSRVLSQTGDIANIDDLDSDEDALPIDVENVALSMKESLHRVSNRSNALSSYITPLQSIVTIPSTPHTSVGSLTKTMTRRLPTQVPNEPVYAINSGSSGNNKRRMKELTSRYIIPMSRFAPPVEQVSTTMVRRLSEPMIVKTEIISPALSDNSFQKKFERRIQDMKKNDKNYSDFVRRES